MTYRHTQVGVLPIILFTTLTATCLFLAASSQLAVMWATAVFVGLVGVGATSLTTRVTPELVEVIFGPGIYRRRIAVPEIISAELARSYALEGWGIRITGEGMLYNITGNQTVRVHLRSGKSLRIGTDDPTGLAAAIGAAVAKHAPSGAAKLETGA